MRLSSSRRTANKRLRGTVSVVVGASSGLGRATAIELAREGSQVVIAARNLLALERLAADLDAKGARALALRTDATDPDQVRRLARAAWEFGGRIDIWINNVGIGAVGSFLDTPLEAHEQVIRANLLSHVYGCYAVLPYMIAQKGGVIIDVNSVGAWSPAPYATAYSAGKFGLRGFTESLRAELERHAGIRLCAVYPAFMDTPGLRHGANYVGRELKPPPGPLDPWRAARAITDLAVQPRRSTSMGAIVPLARLAHGLAPLLTATLTGRFIEAYLARAGPAATSHGNLFEPSAGLVSATGQFSAPGQSSKFARLALFGVGAVAVAFALRR